MALSELSPTAFRDFNIAVVLFQVFGLTAIILLGYWEGHHQQATFEWRNPPEQFWYHPLLMTLSFVFIHGNANLVYRMFRGLSSLTLKWTHAILQLVALILMVVALVAIFGSHNNHRDAQANLAPYPNMYSLHSWIGLSVVILFCLQCAAGIIAFIYPKVNPALKAKYMPVHVYFGISMYVLFIVVAVMGLTEEDFYDVKGFEEKSHEAGLVNTIGLVLVLFGWTGTYLLVNPKFRRMPRASDSGAYQLIPEEV